MESEYLVNAPVCVCTARAHMSSNQQATWASCQSPSTPFFTPVYDHGFSFKLRVVNEQWA